MYEIRNFFIKLVYYIQQFCCEAQLFFFLSSSMRKYYHTIQDQNRFIDSIINLIVDYLKYGNGIDAEDGVFVDEDDNVSLISVKDAPDGGLGAGGAFTLKAYLGLGGIGRECNGNRVCQRLFRYGLFFLTGSIFFRSEGLFCTRGGGNDGSCRK